MAVYQQYVIKFRRFLTKASVLVFYTIAQVSCSNDLEKVNFFAPKEMPYQELDTAVVIRSQEGRLQMVMEAPHIEVYKQPEEKTICPRGVELKFYSGKDKLKTYIRADYGISYDSRQIMELKKNVVIIDYGTGDTSYLKDLNWNGIEHRIYSNHSVKSVNGPRVTLGDAFESDENFESPQIVHQRGTVIINDN